MKRHPCPLPWHRPKLAAGQFERRETLTTFLRGPFAKTLEDVASLFGVFFTRQQTKFQVIRGQRPRNTGDGVLYRRRDNSCGQERVIGGICFGLRSECLNKNKLTVRWRLKHVVRLGGIFFTHQDFEAEAAPGQMIAHAAGSVGLNRGVDARGFESALGKISFDLRGEAVNDHEFAAIHALIICQSVTSGGVWQAGNALKRALQDSSGASPAPTAFCYAESSLARSSASFDERCDFAKSRGLKV